MPKKAIMFVIGLVAVLGFAVVYLAVNNKGTGGVDTVMGQYDSIMEEYDAIRYTRYDGGTAAGSDIIDLLKTMKDDGVSIVVTNGAKEAQTYTYATVTASSSTVLNDVKDRTKTKLFINPSASFKSKVTRDVNGIITTVEFTQV